MAFDTVSHERMALALRRLRVPETLLNAINSMYTNPQFMYAHWGTGTLLATTKGRNTPRMPALTT
eukprot:7578009-Prorocentrum_lima.AAC.1